MSTPALSSAPGPADSPSERLQRVQHALIEACRAAGRAAEEVTLIAVSKRQPDEAVRSLAALGQVDFGENLVQALCARLDSLGDLRPPARWHLIGPVQSNKVKLLAAQPPALLHTVDRERLVEMLGARLEAGVTQDVLIQINVDQEPQKAGVLPGALDALADRVAASPRLRLRGVMCIPRPLPSGAAPEEAFARTWSLAQMVADRTPDGRPLLSMGMSADFAAAVAHGATHVRVGTALFGARPG